MDNSAIRKRDDSKTRGAIVTGFALRRKLSPREGLVFGGESIRIRYPVLQDNIDKQESRMRSQWIEHNGKKVIYQDFSKRFFNSSAVKMELDEVQKVVKAELKASVLVLTDLRNTNVGSELLPAMNAAPRRNKGSCQQNSSAGSNRYETKTRRPAHISDGTTAEIFRRYGINKKVVDGRVRDQTLGYISRSLYFDIIPILHLSYKDQSHHRKPNERFSTLSKHSRRRGADNITRSKHHAR